MTKKAKETEVATKTAFNNLIEMGQEAIPGMLKQVLQKIREIKGLIPTESSITATLQGFGKLDDIKSVEELVKAHSVIIAKERAYNESAKDLGLSTKKYPYMLHGHRATAWISGIQRRVVLVAHKSELDKLNKIKAKLEANLSTKDKLRKDLEDISKLLSND